MQRPILLILSILMATLCGNQVRAWDAVTGLRSGWKQTSILKSNFGISQGSLKIDSTFGDIHNYDEGSLTVDGNGNILYYDQVTLQLKQLAPDSAVSTIGDFSERHQYFHFPFLYIRYQPQHDRVLITDIYGGLLSYQNGEVTSLRPGHLPSSPGGVGRKIIVDPRDESIYGTDMADHAFIRHFNDASADWGAGEQTVVSQARGVFQMVLDAASDKLYYSEIYANRISVPDIASGATSVVASDIGIAGTPEPISVGLDDQGRLYYFTATDGLYRLDDGQPTRLTASISGAGELVWSPTRGLFVQAQARGGPNLIAYPIDGSPAYKLTPSLNAIAIGELSDGRVIVQSSDDNRLIAVTSQGLRAGCPFSTETLATCGDFAIDAAKRLFGVCGDTLLQVLTDGTTTTLVRHAGKNLSSLAYSSLTDEFVYTSSSDSGQGSVTINRIAAGGGSSREIATLQGVTINNVLPSLAVDSQDNIYILERGANRILRIAAGTATTTVWAGNVLDSEAITVPDMVYLPSEDALLVSTIDDYQLWPLDGSARQTFATNNGSVDNFAMMVTGDGSVVAIHSGEVFRMSPAGASTADPRIAQIVAWAEEQYPRFFQCSPQKFEAEGYQVWGYPEIGMVRSNYIGYKNGRFYYLGTTSLGQITDVGTLEQLAAQASLN